MSNDEIIIKLKADIGDFTDKLKDAEGGIDELQKKCAEFGGGSGPSGTSLFDQVKNFLGVQNVKDVVDFANGIHDLCNNLNDLKNIKLPDLKGLNLSTIGGAKTFAMDANKMPAELAEEGSMGPGTASALAEDAAPGGGAMTSSMATIGGMSATAFVAAFAAGLTIGLAGVWLLVKTGALNAIADLGKQFQNACPILMDIFKLLFAPLGIIGAAAIDIMTGQINQIPADIMNVIGQALDAINKLCAPVLDLLNTIGGKINDIINTITGIPAAVSNATKNIGGGIFSGLGSLFGGLQAYADGGIVTGPTIGLIGEAGPEAVIPLRNMSREIVINLQPAPVILNGTKIGEVQTRQIRRRIGA